MMNFSHIYIEKSVANHRLTQDLLLYFPQAQSVYIDNYKQFFNRPNQNFLAQRGSPKLILARQAEHLLHFGSDRVRSFGEPHIVSFSIIRNCMYHCEYCFLSGMHNSANIVIYVNLEDFEDAIKKTASELFPQKIYLVSSYLSDLPAFEHFIPICRMTMEMCKDLKNVDLEIRTKSDAYKYLQAIGSNKNTVLTWSLSPHTIVQKYEHGTASLATRILQASLAIEEGWRVRLCFDPIIYYKTWYDDYKKCVEQTFLRCDARRVEKISFGVFRMGATYLQNMRRIRPGARVLQDQISTKDGLATYPPEIITEIQDTFTSLLLEYLPKEKIHFVHG